MTNLIKAIILKFIRRFNFQKEVLTELLDEPNYQAAEQEKQEIVFQYIDSIIKANKLNRALLLNTLVEVSSDNKLRFNVPELMAISNDHVGMRMLVEGYFEKDLLEFLGKTVFSREEVKNGIALDIGSFIGTHTLYLARYFKHVASFEPNPHMYKVLEANIDAAGVTNVFPLNIGLTREEETLGYYKYDGGNQSMNRFLKQGEDASQYENFVKIGDLVLKNGNEAISDLISKQDLSGIPITLIKIDTEGFETDVLMGLSEVLTNHNVLILFEGAELKKARDIMNLLKGFGYTQFVELQEYLPIIPVPVLDEEKFYPLILGSKQPFVFNS